VSVATIKRQTVGDDTIALVQVTMQNALSSTVLCQLRKTTDTRQTPVSALQPVAGSSLLVQPKLTCLLERHELHLGLRGDCIIAISILQTPNNVMSRYKHRQINKLKTDRSTSSVKANGVASETA
jgi:hypothetical protein